MRFSENRYIESNWGQVRETEELIDYIIMRENNERCIFDFNDHNWSNRYHTYWQYNFLPDSGAHFRKVYHVCVFLWEFFFLNFFIAGSILSGIHSGLSMLIIADILLLCARILHKSKSYISEAIYFLILILNYSRHSRESG